MTAPSWAWPEDSLAEALEALGRTQGMTQLRGDLRPPRIDVWGADEDARASCERWMDAAARWLGAELEHVSAPYGEAIALMSSASPALVMVPRTADAPGAILLLVQGSRRGRVALLTTSLKVVRVPAVDVRAFAAGGLERMIAPRVDALLDDVGVKGSRRAKARQTMIERQLERRPVEGVWLLRPEPGGSWWSHLKRSNAPQRLGRLLALQAVLQVLTLAGWWLLGRGALDGTLDRAWLGGWCLTLATVVPFQLLAAWNAGMLSFEVGAVVKQRLLVGALRMDSEVIRRDGAGALLGRVVESSAVESNALTGGVLAVSSSLQLGSALGVILVGAGGAWMASLFVGWLLLSLAFSWAYVRRRVAWTDARVAMTQDLVEGMVGHRTRLAQEDPAHWHDAEDRVLERYLGASRAYDESTVWLQSLLPRGWTALGMVGLLPALLRGGASPTSIAAGVGAILIAGQALRSVLQGVLNVAGAMVAWRVVAPLFDAARRAEPPGHPQASLAADAQTQGDHAVLEAHAIGFQYPGRTTAVFQGLSLRVHTGDRVLLEGSSGGGKSTLGALLAGLRAPTQGLLLHRGFDAQSLGPAVWRRSVVMAPQFHENHVLANTVAFNLLMGRAWPPHDAALAEAQAVCDELGLAPLLERMPSGMQQRVGESGWELSHGEQSRLFLARALLQRAEVVILDESFAALDPETMARCLRCVFARARTLVVIAHP